MDFTNVLVESLVIAFLAGIVGLIIELIKEWIGNGSILKPPSFSGKWNVFLTYFGVGALINMAMEFLGLNDKFCSTKAMAGPVY